MLAEASSTTELASETSNRVHVDSFVVLANYYC